MPCQSSSPNATFCNIFGDRQLWKFYTSGLPLVMSTHAQILTMQCCPLPPKILLRSHVRSAWRFGLSYTRLYTHKYSRTLIYMRMPHCEHPFIARGLLSLYLGFIARGLLSLYLGFSARRLVSLSCRDNALTAAAGQQAPLGADYLPPHAGEQSGRHQALILHSLPTKWCVWGTVCHQCQLWCTAPPLLKIGQSTGVWGQPPPPPPGADPHPATHSIMHRCCQQPDLCSSPLRAVLLH